PRQARRALLTQPLGKLAIAPGVDAGFEDEGGFGWRLAGEHGVLIPHDEAAVEKFARFDAAAGIGSAVGTRGDLQPPRANAHGVIAGDDAQVAATQGEGKIAWGGTPSGLGLSRRAGKAPAEVVEKRGQERVSRLEGGDAPQTQLADEAVLQCRPEALNPAFGLRRVRADETNAEVAQDAAEVGGILNTAQLLFERPVAIVADKHVQAITIEFDRDAIGAAGLVQHAQIAVQIFGGTKPE